MFRFIAVLLLSLSLWAGALDGVIEKRLRARLARSALKEDRITLQISEGTVTYEGTVKNVQRKGLATRFARESGASEVVNRLRVPESQPQSEPRTVRVIR